MINKDTGLGVRLSENGKLVERVVIKIKVFEKGKWEWKVRQRFLTEPRLKANDFLKILDEIKAEIVTSEGSEVIEGPTPHVEPPANPPKKNKKNKDGSS
jgi:hypothetical protein